MRDHFVEIRDLAGSSRSHRLKASGVFLATVLTAVHGENVRLGAGAAGIAVAFPGMVDPLAMRNALGVVRAFGTPDALAGLVARLDGLIERHEAAVISDILAVDALNVRCGVAFCRDRRPERQTVAFQERATRRAQRKACARAAVGEEILKPPMASAERMAAMVATEPDGADVQRMHVAMRSASTGQGFSLWVTPRFSNESPGGAVDTYGLSRALGTVPLPHF